MKELNKTLITKQCNSIGQLAMILQLLQMNRTASILLSQMHQSNLSSMKHAWLLPIYLI